MEVKRPLIWKYPEAELSRPIPVYDDESGNVLLTCQDDGRIPSGSEWIYASASCFFVVSGTPFADGEILYLPVGISLDGKYESPMIIVNIPFDTGGINRAIYPSHVIPAFLPVPFSAEREDVLDLLEPGDVVFIDFGYDFNDLEAKTADCKAKDNTVCVMRLQRVKENKQVIEAFLRSIQKGAYNLPQNIRRIDLWISSNFGVGK